MDSLAVPTRVYQRLNRRQFRTPPRGKTAMSAIHSHLHRPPLQSESPRAWHPLLTDQFSLCQVGVKVRSSDKSLKTRFKIIGLASATENDGTDTHRITAFPPVRFRRKSTKAFRAP